MCHVHIALSTLKIFWASSPNMPTPFIGRKNRVYEILSRKRPLTLRMIEGLHEVFSIPAESLLKHDAHRKYAH